MYKLDSREKNYQAQRSEPTFLAADLKIDSIYFFHVMFAEN